MPSQHGPYECGCLRDPARYAGCPLPEQDTIVARPDFRLKIAGEDAPLAAEAGAGPRGGLRGWYRDGRDHYGTRAYARAGVAPDAA
ncbi:hypothetical protein GCM10023096_72460 [Nonomuraea ferruginea]